MRKKLVYRKFLLSLHQKIVLANRKATLTVVFLCRLSGAVFYLCFFGTSSFTIELLGTKLQCR